MRGGALPPALIASAIAFSLAFAPRKAIPVGIGLFMASALAALKIPIAPAWIEWVFAGCWMTVAVTAASVHMPGGIKPWLAFVFSANAGLWAGAVISVSGQPLDLARASACLLLVLPAAWLVATRRGIVIKVVASWLIAIAILSAALPLVPTPGYKPDHME